MEAAQGRAPCGACGAVNAPPANPFGPEMFAQRPMMAASAEQSVAHTWFCAGCRHENQARYEFCLGCGAARSNAGGAHFEGRRGFEGNPAGLQGPSPVALIAIIVGVVVALAAVGVAVMVIR